MGWTELDFMTGKPKRPRVETPEEKAARLAEMEPMRLARRAKARERLAECELAEQRAAEVEDNIAAVESRIEQHTAEHQQCVAPWQAALSKVEAEQLQRVRDQRDPDKQLDGKRRDLLDQIRSATAELEQLVGEEHRLLSQLHQELSELRTFGSVRVDAESDLRIYGRPDLLLAMKVAGHEFHRQHAYLASIRERYTQEPSDFWAAVLTGAERDLEAKQAASTAAVQAVMDE